MNSGLYKYLSEEYIKTVKPQYAVFINGKWGCGKTYFVKKWIDDIAKKKGKDKSNNHSINPIYVSLYGLKKTKDITVSINRALYPILYGKLAKVGKTALKLASSIVFKQDIDFNGDGKSDTTINIDLDSLSLFKSNDKSIKSSKFIVFDDIERCLIDMKELLGYINYFTEHCDCHVLIVGDESQIRKEDIYTFDKFKEKTIGREFLLNTEIDAAIKNFVKDIPNNTFIFNHIESITSVFKATRCNNLRILRQSLWDFSNQEKLVNYNKKDEWSKLVMNNVLCSFIATFCEYKGNNKEHILKWKEIYTNSPLLLNEEKNIKIRDEFKKIENRYQNMTIKTAWDVFSTDIVFNIISYIETGTPITNFINSLLNTPKEKTSWDKLQYAEFMSNDEFSSTYDSAINALIKEQITDYKSIGDLLYIIAYYDARNIKCLDNTQQRTIINALCKILNKSKTAEECYDNYIQCIRRINIRHSKYKSPLLDIFCDTLKTEYEKILSNRKDSMTLLLENLTDGNCDELYVINNKSIPDHSKTYSSVPIFHRISIDKLFDSLKKTGNRGRHIFNHFIRERYMLNYDNSAELNRERREDAESLRALNSKIKLEKENRILTEKLSFDMIYDSIEEAIKSCEDSIAINSLTKD